MVKFGCIEKFINIVRQFHDGMMARVMENGDVSWPFEVSNGVKQGCVLAPTPFSIMFSAMQYDAFNEVDNGCILLKYRIDGKLFNTRSLLAKSKVCCETQCSCMVFHLYMCTKSTDQ